MKINDAVVINQLKSILKDCEAMAITKDKVIYNLAATHMWGRLETLIALLEEGETDEQ